MNLVDDFVFQDVDPLRDGELSVVLAEKKPADLVKGWVPAYVFELRVDGAVERAGTVTLRVGHTHSLETYAGHFGYTVDPAWRGRHFAERAVRLLLPLAGQHGLSTVWITCDPDNWPSRRTCERLGGELCGIVPLPPDHEMYLAGSREKCRYRIDLSSLPTVLPQTK